MYKRSRHSEQRARNLVSSHVLRSGLHKQLLSSSQIRCIEQCKVEMRLVEYSERCQERREHRKNLEKQRLRDAACGQASKAPPQRQKRPRPPAYEPPAASSRVDRRPPVNFGTAAATASQAEMVVQEARQRLQQLVGEDAGSELAAVLSQEVPITFLPPSGRLGVESAQREISVRLCELQFMKDQVDRGSQQLTSAARSMVDSVKQLNGTAKTLTEVSVALGRVIAAVAAAAENEIQY